MPTKNTGGPAFPVLDQPSISDGMTLRDWYAGKAMEGYIAQCVGTAGAANPKHIALFAFEIADAMLAAREAE